MKKISLNSLVQNGIELLERTILKNIVGGESCDNTLCPVGFVLTMDSNGSCQCVPEGGLDCPNTSCTHMDEHNYTRTSYCMSTTIGSVTSCKCTTDVRSDNC